MNEELGNAFALTMAEFKEEYGEDAKLKDGDEFVTVFNNCTMIIGLENSELQLKLVGGKAYHVDCSVSIFEED